VRGRGGGERGSAHELLGRKDRVHDGDVGGGEVRGDGENEQTGVREEGRVMFGRGGRGGGRVGGDGEAIDI
jgi:hypothetical protein